MQVLNKIEISKADITSIKVDAIVNAANNSLMGGGGVDGAIHRSAGKALLDECRLLKGCETGQSKITKGHALPAKFIIHTVGPAWNNGTENEEALLKSCYDTCLQLAVDYHLTTIAFPCISTGAYRFPFEKAANVALKSITAFLQQHQEFEKIYLICYSDKDVLQYQRVLAKQNF